MSVPNKPNPYPEFLTSEKPIQDKQLEDWLYAFFFHAIAEKRGIDLNDPKNLEDLEVIARLNANAKYQVLKKTSNLRAVAVRSMVQQLYNAQKEGWPQLIEDVGDVKELLQQMMLEAGETDPEGGNFYELKFLVETLLPTLERYGIPSEKIIGISANLSKARRSIPRLREELTRTSHRLEELEKEQNADPSLAPDYVEEKQAEIIENIQAVIMEELDDITNPNITVTQFIERSKARSGKAITKKEAEVLAKCYILPNKTMIVLECPPNKNAPYIIQGLLQGYASGFNVADPKSLMQDISANMAPRLNKMKRFVIKQGMLVEDPEGFMLPDPKVIEATILEKIFEFEFVIKQKKDLCIPLMRTISFSSQEEAELYSLTFLKAPMSEASKIIDEFFNGLTKSDTFRETLAELGINNYSVCSVFLPSMDFGLFLKIGEDKHE